MLGGLEIGRAPPDKSGKRGEYVVDSSLPGNRNLVTGGRTSDTLPRPHRTFPL